MLLYRCEDSPVFGGEIAESFGIEFHGWRSCRRFEGGHEVW